MVPVLLVTGPIGVGKTTVLHEADSLLIEAGVRHATVELEEIARCWTEAIETLKASFVYKNLAALWLNFAAVDLVESDQRPVQEIARDMLRLAGWLT